MVRALRIRGGAGSHRKIFNEAVSRSVFVNVMNIAIKYIYIYIYTHMHRHHGVYRWVKISSSSPRKKNSFLPSFVRELVHFPLLLRSFYLLLLRYSRTLIKVRFPACLPASSSRLCSPYFLNPASMKLHFCLFYRLITRFIVSESRGSSALGGRFFRFPVPGE